MAIPLLVDPGDLDRANGRVIAAMTILITRATNVRAANVVAGVVTIVSGAVLIAALRHLDEATPNAA